MNAKPLQHLLVNLSWQIKEFLENVTCVIKDNYAKNVTCVIKDNYAKNMRFLHTEIYVKR